MGVYLDKTQAVFNVTGTLSVKLQFPLLSFFISLAIEISLDTP